VRREVSAGAGYWSWLFEESRRGIRRETLLDYVLRVLLRVAESGLRAGLALQDPPYRCNDDQF
jgi:hypothetical protein